jgi:hypothetical protein
MSTTIMISLTVMTEDETTAVRVMETLTRVMVGFAFEGVYASVSANRHENDES